MSKQIVHVVGPGTIGEPLIGLFTAKQKEFGIDEITFCENTVRPYDKPKLETLRKRGARLAIPQENIKDFEPIGVKPDMTNDEALKQATVVVDCTPMGNKNKENIYKNYASTVKGFIAQGSEFGFGKQYARGVNDRALDKEKDRFIQIVSCNTHNLAVLINTIAYNNGKNYDNLSDGRFLCIRRANDVSQDKDFVPSPKVEKHKDGDFGTHHAHDVYHLFGTLDVKPRVFSSALKINSQYMHAIWFSLILKEKITIDEVMKRLKANELVARTQKASANMVFSFGRDHGHYGRLLNQTVIVEPTVHVRDGHEAVGFCYTPQDGNSLLSSVSATLWFLDPKDYEKRIQCLKPYFFEEI